MNTSAPAYTLQRAVRKTMAIHVKAGRVEVRAPLHVSLHEIDKFVRSKSAWINTKLSEMVQRHTETLQLADGDFIDVMGERLKLRWVGGTTGRVWRDNQILWIAGRALNAERVNCLFLRWLADEAAARLLPRAKKAIADWGLSPKLHGFTLRYTRSLWGRCTGGGDILFNPLILLAPLPVMDYLIAHEACHLRHMNHSPAFWQQVATHCPDWQTSRRWLKEHGHRLRVV